MPEYTYTEKHTPLVFRAVGTSDASTTSTSFVDIPELSLSFNLPYDCICIFILNISPYLDKGVSGGAYFRLVLDGNLLTGRGSYMTGAEDLEGVFCYTWVEQLSAGNHTLTAQWSCSTGTLYNRSSTYPDDETRWLEVICFPVV